MKKFVKFEFSIYGLDVKPQYTNVTHTHTHTHTERERERERELVG